jgi:hypothetical protein
MTLIEEEEAAMTTQRHDRRACRQARFLLESLDDRLVLSAGVSGAAAAAVAHHPSAHHAQIAGLQHDAQTARRGDPGHLAPAPQPVGVSPALRILYRDYEYEGARTPFVPGTAAGKSPRISGNRVAVIVKAAFPSAINAYLQRFRNDGLQVIKAIPTHGQVEGMLPIGALPALAQDAAFVKPAPVPHRTLR